MPELSTILRDELLETLQLLIHEAEENELLVSQLVIRIQHYKDVCIEYGYSAADDVVDEFVSDLSHKLRQEDYFCQIAPDEFVVVLRGLKSQAQTLMAINKIERVAVKPFAVGDRNIKLVLAIGAATGPRDGKTSQALLRCADTALREAERKKMTSVVYKFREEINCKPSLQLATELESALNEGELKGHYQPIVDVRSGELASVEMLSRWFDGPSGTVSPSVFIDTAEQSGLIMPLTLWCLHCGLRESSQWQNVPNDVSLAINFSTLVLTDPHLPEAIHSALELWSVPPDRLIVEVTESALMSNPERCLETLNWLNGQGVRIAIDDFGTGYSSLSYLKQLPVSLIKIDQSFVTNMNQSTADKNIVQSVIDLAGNFGLTVVAEGVEDLGTFEQLVTMGCDRIQGFFVSRSMSSEALEAWCDSPKTHIPKQATARSYKQ